MTIGGISLGEVDFANLPGQPGLASGHGNDGLIGRVFDDLVQFKLGVEICWTCAGLSVGAAANFSRKPWVLVGLAFGCSAAPTHLGSAWLRFFKIPEDRYAIFHVNLMAAAGFHDWGKANDGFQKMLRSEGEDLIRHEHLSGLLLALDDVTDWLKQRPDLDADLVLSAVLTHHLKINIKEFAAYRGGLTTLQLARRSSGFPESCQGSR